MQTTKTVLRPLELSDFNKGKSARDCSGDLRADSMTPSLFNSLFSTIHSSGSINSQSSIRLPISLCTGYLDLLSQLTQVGDYGEEAFKERFLQLQSLSDMYKVMVIEGKEKLQYINIPYDICFNR